MRGEKYDKQKTYDVSMECGWTKSVTCWQFLSHQVCRIPVKHLWETLIVQGGKHNYFLIGLDYSKQVTVKESMIKYLGSVLQEFPEHLDTTASTPSADHLFIVQDEGET